MRNSTFFKPKIRNLESNHFPKHRLTRPHDERKQPVQSAVTKFAQNGQLFSHQLKMFVMGYLCQIVGLSTRKRPRASIINSKMLIKYKACTTYPSAWDLWSARRTTLWSVRNLRGLQKPKRFRLGSKEGPLTPSIPSLHFYVKIICLKLSKFVRFNRTRFRCQSCKKVIEHEWNGSSVSYSNLWRKHLGVNTRADWIESVNSDSSTSQ